MERLTVNDLNKVCYDPWDLCGMDNYCKKGCHEEGGCTKDCHILKMYRKLSEYEDLEEQGKMMKLPCAEVYESSGDFVYYIFEDEIVKGINCGAQIEADGNIVFTLDANEKIFPYREPDSENDLSPEDWCEKTITLTVCEWNKTVFLTHEEAEAALKELEGKNGNASTNT